MPLAIPRSLNVYQVSNDDAFAMARRPRQGGRLAGGISTGANESPPSKSPASGNKGNFIVTIACSDG